MTQSQGIQDDLCTKLRTVGLPREIVLPLVNSITRSVSAEGPENVVKRLKILKQAAVNHLAGQEVDFPWIAHNAKGPKGPWAPVWKMLASSQYKHKKRAINAMMVYASFVLPKAHAPTPTQERKFLESVVQTDQEVLIRAEQSAAFSNWEITKTVLSELTSVNRCPDFKPVYPDLYVYCAQRNGTDPQGMRKSERVINNFMGGHAGRHFHMFPEVKAVLGEMGEEQFSLTHPWNGAWKDWKESTPSTATEVLVGNRPTLDCIGVVGFSQEPGLKFRAFAAPNIVLQAALEPLKAYLLDYLKSLPWDSTHNQDQGVLDVQQWLKEEKTVYSVDLSDATNNFPLDFQMKVLRSMKRFPESTLVLFENVCRSEYRLMWDTHAASVAWNVGQPLGAGPSFPVFALSHACVALAAEKDAGVPLAERGTTFKILGDDFVTCNEKVHDAYRRILKTLRCPISESKCLVSPLAGEFAGKLIMKDHVYHGFKYKEMSNVSFMPIIRTLGQQALSRKFLSRDQYEYAKLVRSFPEPFGLGFNPEGISLAERYEKYLLVREMLDMTKSDVQTISVAEARNLFLYNAQSDYFRNRMRWVSDEANKVHPDLLDPKGNLWDRRSVDEYIRNTQLVPLVVQRGDPRPEPLLGVKTSKLSGILDKADGLMHVSESTKVEMTQDELSSALESFRNEGLKQMPRGTTAPITPNRSKGLER